jgi:hypothetical protein
MFETQDFQSQDPHTVTLHPMSTIKPRAPLPWERELDEPRVPQYAPRQCRAIYSVGGPNTKLVVAANLGAPEADYIVHSANAYPKLVEVLAVVADPSFLKMEEAQRFLLSAKAWSLLAELGELPEKSREQGARSQHGHRTRWTI